MSNNSNWKFELEEYIKQGEQGKTERIEAWRTKFTSDIWKIHPFCEGNTRATAVFIIKYLKTLGFHVSNDVFVGNS